MSTHETLGLMLVREGIIHRSQLYDALRLQRQNNRLLGTCLLSLGYINADKLLQILSEQLQVPVLPPGSLKWASEEAVRLVSGDLALKLRIVPYSFDGQMLGVAVADGRVLEHLHAVAKQANAAVGAYIALEMEIEAALGKLYGHAEVAGPLSEPADPLPGRPRPMRIEAVKEVPSRDFASALGIDDGVENPVVLGEPKPSPETPPSIPISAGPRQPTPLGAVKAEPRRPPGQGSALPAYSPPQARAAPVDASSPREPAPPPRPRPPAAPPPMPKPPVAPRLSTAPPPAPAATPPPAPAPAATPPPATAPAATPPPATAPAATPPPPPVLDQRVARGPPTDPPLERLSFFAAVEHIYAANTPDGIGAIVGQAMLNYFERVMVFALRARQLVIIAYGGVEPARTAVALEAVPEVVAGLGHRNMAYGIATDHARGEEICDMFAIGEAETCFLAPIVRDQDPIMVVYADNGDRVEIYDDLHDVELLFKEAETALEMLGTTN